MKLKLFSTFSGIGGFEKGIIKAGIDLEIVGHSDIKKHAEKVNELLDDEIKRQQIVQNGYDLLKLHHYTQILPEYIKFLNK
ncbi:MAG TPA: hypothetical protein DDY21_00050 [Candidatus Moranbacteria bacterium]|nr:hypothetical protein [Candidatus Moranbacteria bacterium]